MPEHDPGVVAVGLVPAIALPGEEGPDLDEQVRCPGTPVENLQVP